MPGTWRAAQASWPSAHRGASRPYASIRSSWCDSETGTLSQRAGSLRFARTDAQIGTSESRSSWERTLGRLVCHAGDSVILRTSLSRRRSEGGIVFSSIAAWARLRPRVFWPEDTIRSTVTAPAILPTGQRWGLERGYEYDVQCSTSRQNVCSDMPEGREEEETVKGITTLYDETGLFPVVSVSKKGVPRPLKRRQPKWARVRSVDYLQGGTLARIKVYEGKGTGRLKAAVRFLGEAQLARQCDDCVRKHRPTNKKCSATMGIDTVCTNEKLLYDWNTKKPVGRYRTGLIQIGGRDKVGTAEFIRE